METSSPEAFRNISADIEKLGEVEVNEKPLLRRIVVQRQRNENKWKEQVGGNKGTRSTECGREVRQQTQKIWEDMKKEKETERKPTWGTNQAGKEGGRLHFWDDEKFIAPSPAAILNQRRICIADGPRRNKINLSLISRGGLKISPSLMYVCVVPWHSRVRWQPPGREPYCFLKPSRVLIHTYGS